MNGLLADIAALGGEPALAAAVVFLRVGGAMAALPAFGEMFIPARIRLGLAFAFTLVVLPAVYPVIAPLARAADGAVAVAGLIIGEAAIGLVLGLVVRLFVFALQTAGTIIAQASSLAQLFGFAAGDPMPTVSQLLMLAALAVAVASGLHVRLAELLIWSYTAFPPGEAPAAADAHAWITGTLSRTFGLAFSLAAPFLAASLIYNIALGTINRAMPQLMVTFVGAPAMTAGALVLLAVMVPFLAAIWVAAVEAFLAAPAG